MYSIRESPVGDVADKVADWAVIPEYECSTRMVLCVCLELLVSSAASSEGKLFTAGSTHCNCTTRPLRRSGAEPVRPVLEGTVQREFDVVDHLHSRSNFNLLYSSIDPYSFRLWHPRSHQTGKWIRARRGACGPTEALDT